MRRFLGLFALGALMATSAMPVAARQPGLTSAGIDLKPSSVLHGNKSQSGRLAKSDADLLGRNDAQLVNVMIKLDVDAAATYKGGINGLQATSPSVTGKSLKENGAAVAAYRQHVNGVSAKVSRSIKAAVPAAQLRKTYTVAFGGIAA